MSENENFGKWLKTHFKINKKEALDILAIIATPFVITWLLSPYLLIGLGIYDLIKQNSFIIAAPFDIIAGTMIFIVNLYVFMYKLDLWHWVFPEPAD